MAFDLKDPRNQKLVLVVLVLCLGVYFWYTRVFSPNGDQIASKISEHERILGDLRSVEMKAKSFDALKEEYEVLFSQYINISSLLPDNRQLEGFLLQLHQTALTTEIRVTSVTPQAPASTGFYITSGFQMEVEGTYHSLGRFFASVANFPFIANIRNVQIAAVPMGQQDTQGRKKRRTLTATFEISTYFASEEAAIQPLNL
jgi:type IV pilus assembly protein PilO